MSIDQETFENELPIPEDWVTTRSANVGPILNRQDILDMYEVVGDVEYLFDENNKDFIFSEQEIRNQNIEPFFIRNINQEKINKGSLSQLITTDNSSIVNSINSIKKEMYNVDRNIDILEDYTLNAKGDFIKNGLQTSFDEVKKQSYSEVINRNLYRFNYLMTKQRFILPPVRTQNGILDTSSYTLQLDDLLSSPWVYTYKFTVQPGTCFIGGKKLVLSEPVSMFIPIIEAPHYGETVYLNIFLKYETMIEIYKGIEWRDSKHYNYGQYVYYNSNIYMSKEYISAGDEVPTSNEKWEFVTAINESYNKVSQTYLDIQASTKTTLENGLIHFNETIPPKSMFLGTIVKTYNSTPVVYNNENSRAYTSSKLESLKEQLIGLNDGIARLQSNLDLQNTDIISLTRNWYTESFYNDLYRETELEFEFPPAVAQGGLLTPYIEWDSFGMIDETLQLDILNGEETTQEQQLHYTDSTFINEFGLDQPSIAYYPGVSDTFLHETVRVEDTDTSARVVRTTTSDWRRAGTFTTWEFNRSFTTNLEPNGTRLLNKDVTKSFNFPQYTFDSSETVKLYIDDILIGTYTANANGSLASTYTVGPNRNLESSERYKKWYDERYKIRFIGTKSLVEVHSNISFLPFRKTDVFTRVNTIVTFDPPWSGDGGGDGGGDPVSQTWLASSSYWLSSIEVIFDIYFNAEWNINTDDDAYNPDRKLANSYPNGSDFILPGNVGVGICECTAGMPDKTKILYMQDIPTGTAVNNHKFHKINLKEKIYIEEGKVYAFILISEYSTRERNIPIANIDKYFNSRLMVRTAKLGKVTPYTPYILINQQPFINGAMWKSSNIITWSPYQEEDLAFKINSCKFDSTKVHECFEVIDDSLQDFTYTDILVDCVEKGYSSTNINKSVTIEWDDTEIEDTVLSLENGSPRILTRSDVKSVIPTLTLSTIDEDLTPTIYPQSTIRLGRVASESVFVSKNIDLNLTKAVQTKNMKIVIDAMKDWNPSNIEIYYNTNVAITDSNWTQIFFTRNGDYYIERIFEADNVELFQHLRFKIILKVPDEDTSKRITISNFRLFLED